MKLLLTILLAIALFSVTQGVVISWEESLEGKIDYRLFYLTISHEDSGTYYKPAFGLINGIDGYEYGALGSLDCPQTGISVAAYHDINGDDINEWRCYSVNILPFAHLPSEPSPPICGPLAPSGIPAIYNLTAGAYECGTYNQILTLATREDISVACGTADFLMYYESVDEIRCVNPQDISPDLTLQARDVRDVDLEERVDTRNDKKWYNIMSDMEVTTVTTKTWNNWKWIPFMNYDSTSASSAIPTPPFVLPFSCTLLAVTVVSFKISSYTFSIVAPVTGDHFTVTASRLSSGLTATTISDTMIFDSISATSGQVTFNMAGNPQAGASAGESFVAGVSNKVWTALPSTSDRHVVAITLWMQTSQSFTAYWPLI